MNEDVNQFAEFESLRNRSFLNRDFILITIASFLFFFNFHSFILLPIRIQELGGGASFIGSQLVDALVERGAKVRVVDNLSSGRIENIQRNCLVGNLEYHLWTVCAVPSIGTSVIKIESRSKKS